MKDNALAILHRVKTVFGRRTKKAGQVLKNSHPEKLSPNPAAAAQGAPRESPNGKAANGASVYKGPQKVHAHKAGANFCRILLFGSIGEI